MLATVLLFGISSTISYAAHVSDCVTDADQMRAQISKYASITARDGNRFNGIANPYNVSDTVCTATGYYMRHLICNIQWNVGNWGNTFHCA